MKTFSSTVLTNDLISCIADTFGVERDAIAASGIQLSLNHEAGRGDFATNAAMVLARTLKQAPRAIAEKIVEGMRKHEFISSLEVAGPGFINITLHPAAWATLAKAIAADATAFFTKEHDTPAHSYLLEFVSANPTGPLHLGHGRGAIVGDVLQRLLRFAGHKVHTEFYVNDAGSQMQKLGNSLRTRCAQALGSTVEMPEDGYHGDYLVELAADCVKEYGEAVLEKETSFFTGFAHDALIATQEKDLRDYRVVFEEWFSEKSLHNGGAVEEALQRLQANGYLYEQDGAWWFASTKFGDDKDRVIRKEDGSLTYIAADIAYHVNKFERGYQTLVNFLGQDHHGYVMRLKGTMSALGYNADDLRVVLYQLVSIKKGSIPVRMSKRSGNFTSLRDVIDAVGVDSARFYFLNKKSEAHLEFDVELALKKSNENPVFYLQYAYVRAVSVLAKAAEQGITPPASVAYDQFTFDAAEVAVLKQALGLAHTIKTVEQSLGTHLLACYALDMAQAFHSFYTNNKVIDPENMEVTQRRLALVVAVQQVLGLTHDLLGLTRRKAM
ncbi:MAG: arginine--tRNA ligase [Candidatus Dependentiae bacterium]|jgi:arginyl-tRNA synthetase